MGECLTAAMAAASSGTIPCDVSVVAGRRVMPPTRGCESAGAGQSLRARGRREPAAAPMQSIAVVERVADRGGHAPGQQRNALRIARSESRGCVRQEYGVTDEPEAGFEQFRVTRACGG